MKSENLLYGKVQGRFIPGCSGKVQVAERQHGQVSHFCATFEARLESRFSDSGHSKLLITVSSG